MDQLTKLLTNQEPDARDRRRVLQLLGLGAAAAVIGGAMPHTVRAFAQGARTKKVFPVTTVNHLSYASLDPIKVRDFYVDFFGMRAVWFDGVRSQVDCGPEDAPNSLYITQAQKGVQPNVAHFAFGVPNFWALRDEMHKEMLARGYKGVREDGEAGWFVDGPSGYVNQPVTVKDPAMFPGAASPCEKAKSDKCRAAYEAGLKNLSSIPKPSGTGFKALYFKYIVLRVPDVAAERDFYIDLHGMKVVSDKKDDVSLRFGENTLVLRPSAPGAKPSCREFGFVVENYDEAKVKAEATKRGLSPAASPFGGLTVKDPNGLDIGIGGRS